MDEYILSSLLILETRSKYIVKKTEAMRNKAELTVIHEVPLIPTFRQNY
jgi:hypothetical protein